MKVTTTLSHRLDRAADFQRHASLSRRWGFLMPNHRKEMTGQRFGSLVVVGYAGHQRRACRCDCGIQKTVLRGNLVNGSVKSCGCRKIEALRSASTVHGDSSRGKRTTEYSTWVTMRQRCSNPNWRSFKNYGGRGITVCQRWQSFENFLADMGRKPSPRHTIERKDNNGGYGPDNCKWATMKEQRNNARSNHFLTHNGRTMSITLWSEALGMDRDWFMRQVHSGKTVQQIISKHNEQNRNAVR